MRRIKFLLVFVLLALIGSTTLAIGQRPADTISTEEDVRAVLLDYSASLSIGHVATESYYSPAIRDLLQERRGFYAEFFGVGLHSDLLSIESDFTMESLVEDSGQDELYHVGAVETVTLHGRYRCLSPEEYPLIRSGRWALAKAEDPTVKKAIEGYIERMMDGINRSVKEDSFEAVFIVHHNLVVNSSKKGLKIVQDSFTDAANDNPEGHDSVSWVDEEFVRHRPDLTKMPDYEIYHTSVEEMGESLLDTYSRICGENKKATSPSSPRGSDSYNRYAAAQYINRWVKNTSITCAPDVPQDQSNWNPAYNPIWCNDCANYVSQALKAGGHTTNSTWNPSTVAWKYVPSLKSFLITSGRGFFTSYLSNLQVGDIAFQGSSHVVMVGAIGPHRYSAHTSDRKRAPWHGSINGYMSSISTS